MYNTNERQKLGRQFWGFSFPITLMSMWACENVFPWYDFMSISKRYSSQHKRMRIIHIFRATKPNTPQNKNNFVFRIIAIVYSVLFACMKYLFTYRVCNSSRLIDSHCVPTRLLRQISSIDILEFILRLNFNASQNRNWRTLWKMNCPTMSSK